MRRSQGASPFVRLHEGKIRELLDAVRKGGPAANAEDEAARLQLLRRIQAVLGEEEDA